jgi:integrase
VSFCCLRGGLQISLFVCWGALAGKGQDTGTLLGLRPRDDGSAAIRRGELIALQPYDVDCARTTLMIRQGKGNKDRVVPLRHSRRGLHQHMRRYCVGLTRARINRETRCDCSTIPMISSFSDAGYLIRRRPHPRSCYFEQTVLERQVGHTFLPGTGFAAQVLHLAAGRGTSRVTRQARLPASKNSFD